MATQLYSDKFGSISYDDTRSILELHWLAETENMSDDDYMGWLMRYAESSIEHHALFLLIDTRAFKHHPGAHTWAWREEHVIPRYHQAGVKKFAFLLPPGAETKTDPVPEGSAQFPTGYFDSREQIEQWFLT